MDEIQKLRDRLVELHETSKAVQAKADAEKRDLTEDESKELDMLSGEFDQVEGEIQRRERVMAQEQRLAAPGQRQTAPAQPAAAAASAPAPSAPRDGLQHTRMPTAQERGRWGFKHFGEFANAVKNAALNPGASDGRLLQNATLSTYGSEGAGTDGGFAVPPEWRSEIMGLVQGEDSLITRTDQQTASGNSITFPVDETTAWQSTGGIQAYWDGEAGTMTQSKPSLKELSLKLTKLTAIVPVTDELLEDSASMGSYITGKAGEKFVFKLNDALLNGTGAGMPLGILNAPCLVSVAKESSQTAATFHADNAVKMMARMPASSYSRSVWLINQDVVPQIMQLGFVVKSASGTAAGAGALYLPPNGISNGTYGSLLGRPIVVTEACQTLGTKGDIILADLGKYLTIVKGTLRSDASIHLFFDQNVTAFKFVLRVNGQPWLSAAIARKNGSNTLSHFVSLDTRA